MVLPCDRAHSDAVYYMLRHIYGLETRDPTGTIDAIKLLIALLEVAKEYEIPLLFAQVKLQMASQLEENIGSPRFHDEMSYIHNRGEGEHKQIAMGVFRDNLSTIMESEDIEELLERVPELAVDVYKGAMGPLESAVMASPPLAMELLRALAKFPLPPPGEVPEQSGSVPARRRVAAKYKQKVVIKEEGGESY